MTNVTRKCLLFVSLFCVLYAPVILLVFIWIFFFFYYESRSCALGICFKKKKKIGTLLTIQSKKMSFENKSYPICAPWNIPKPQQTDISLLIVEDVSVFLREPDQKSLLLEQHSCRLCLHGIQKADPAVIKTRLPTDPSIHALFYCYCTCSTKCLTLPFSTYICYIYIYIYKL